jgi:hypothetical protein
MSGQPVVGVPEKNVFYVKATIDKDAVNIQRHYGSISLSSISDILHKLLYLIQGYNNWVPRNPTETLKQTSGVILWSI